MKSANNTRQGNLRKCGTENQSESEMPSATSEIYSNLKKVLMDSDNY